MTIGQSFASSCSQATCRRVLSQVSKGMEPRAQGGSGTVWWTLGPEMVADNLDISAGWVAGVLIAGVFICGRYMPI